jgi:hypothetical protein
MFFNDYSFYDGINSFFQEDLVFSPGRKLCKESCCAGMVDGLCTMPDGKGIGPNIEFVFEVRSLFGGFSVNLIAHYQR